METISHRELRNNSAEILRRVAAGESFTVTNHGEVAAVIAPPELSELDRLRQAGRVRAATKPRQFSKLPRVSGPPTSEILDDLRRDY
ncbi:MAG TPA: type II toxin-antitoxin system prevent-host-death family antitoxin [Actinomycetales bacterium]|nr:type II toxin-antitoxin system prevent-host-death family antitoxin [Actinomycetales bacterium]